MSAATNNACVAMVAAAEKVWMITAVLQALSMGIHESQSLLWERMVGLSEPFSQYLTPQLAAAFPQLPKDLKPEQVRLAQSLSNWCITVY